MGIIQKEDIQNKIFTIRGLQVMLDSDLAPLYDTETKFVNRAVKRNPKRFPESFVFQLTDTEWEDLKYQLGTSSTHGSRRTFPHVFTEQGEAISPDLVFKSPYFLDFTGLKGMYSERSLEDSLIVSLEHFIMELGNGFSFVERQKRMIIDGEDFYLDLLFYHRKLKRLIAIELKLGKFKAAYKGQMELYLRWLDKNEKQAGEETPLGLILCAEGGQEQLELLQLEKSGIKVAEYLTELPDLKLLKQKLKHELEIKRQLMDNHKNYEDE